MSPTNPRILPYGTAAIAEAAALIRAGQCVAVPTETVYGLAADATDSRAVAGIYAAKGRPRFNPLIAHVESLEAAGREGEFNETAENLARALWPGPLTLVVPAARTCTVSDLARAGLDSVALRVPSHPIAQALLRATAFPVVAPSANLSGRVSPTEAAHVLGDLDGCPIFASETCALDIIGARFVRDVKNGEVVVCEIQPDGRITIDSLMPPAPRPERR